jgi:hypothetical protein
VRDLVGAAAALFQELGTPIAPDEAETYERTIETLGGRLDADRLAALGAEGAALPLAEALSEALDLAQTPSG